MLAGRGEVEWGGGDEKNRELLAWEGKMQEERTKEGEPTLHVAQRTAECTTTKGNNANGGETSRGEEGTKR